MKKGNLSALIAMISVFVMLAWGFLANSFQYSWLAVFAGGIAIVAVSMLKKDEDENDDDIA